MIRPNPRARAAAIAIALLSAAQLAAGIALTGMLGGFTGQDLGAHAANEAFARAAPLLVLAEILKLLVAFAQAIVVPSVAAAAPAPTARMATLVSGMGGALLIAASGLLGLYAVAAQDPGYGPLVADLGFAGLGATGIFALVLLSFEAPRLRRWHAFVTLLFGLACLIALFYAPAVLLTAPLGWAFWLGLAGRLRHR
ncbi:MAG TPA: hypothetical protein VGB79_03900 [Allosphingosinicella sp.]|jgi:hypothetical protein